MKRNILLIGIVLATLLIGSVIAEETVIAEKPTLIETIISLFTGQSQIFTIVGVDVGASVTPDETFDNIPPNTGFTKYASDYCSSGHGLWDVYVNNYVPRFEMKDKVSFTCSSGNTKCIAELYCMPRDFCDSTACPSGYTCTTKTATDPYMPLKDANTGATITSYKYCKATQGCTGTSKTCYRVSSSNPLTCESSTYSCSYSTYQTIIDTNCASGAGSFIYSSSSSCQTHTCTPDNSCAANTCTGSSCTNNCGQTVSGTKNCGTQCSSGQILCSDGVCRTTCETPTGNADFQVDVLSVSPFVFYSETLVDISVKIKNNGGTGSMKVEVGLYKDSDIADWGFVVAADATNCEPNEQNVDTKLITLDAGEETTQTFTITTPKVCREILDPIGDFDILALSFINCKNTGQAVGVTSSSRYNVMFTPQIDCVGSCTNGIRDGEEVDTDCGGSQCNKCRSGWKCEKITDCQSGLSCTAGYCSPGDSSRGNQKGLDPSKISEMTAEDLAASACTQTIQCANGSSCKSLKYLTDEGIITDEEANQLLDKSTIFFGSAGAVGGIGACIAGAAALAIPTAGATAILFPLCGLAGGALGLGINEIWDKFTTKDKNAAGYCILEKSSGLDAYFKWAAWFDITGDGVKDGTDGMIIVLIGGAILLILFMRR